MLRTFVEVADAGNITDASEVLGRTPSAVSMTLKQLEELLGRPLFEGDRKSKLTSLGAFVLEQARREVSHFQRTVGSIERFASNEIGHISLACVPSFASQVLPGVLRQFGQKWPEVSLDIIDTDSENVRQMVELEQVDVGVASVPGPRSEIGSLPLLRDSFGVVCRKDHKFASMHGTVTFRDLRAQPFISNGLCARISASPIQYILEDSRLMVRNTTSLIALIEAGIGITILPELALPADHPSVCFVPLAEVGEQRELSIITLSRRTLSPAAQVLIEALLEYSAVPGRRRGRGAAMTARIGKP